jgi:hypothetical protein
MKPIPTATVKLYFSVIDTEILEEDGSEVNRFRFEFNFENESLIQRLDGNTMRTNMFESWINNLIEKKFKISSQLHLGTEFEHTRAVD